MHAWLAGVHGHDVRTLCRHSGSRRVTTMPGANAAPVRVLRKTSVCLCVSSNCIKTPMKPTARSAYGMLAGG
jgi:hypothetical protein